MVKMRQRHITILEFEQGTSEELIAYIDYNKDFICNYCLAFHMEIDSELANFLNELKVNYFHISNKEIFENSKNLKKTSIPILLDNKENQSATQKNSPSKRIKITFDKENKEPITTEQIIDSNLSPHSQEQAFQQHSQNLLPTIFFERPIRSGEEIILDSHAIFLKSINAGAIIKTSGNLQIYGKCDGILESLGDYIIIQEFDMGRISLQGVQLERKMLKYIQSSKKLKIITIKNGMIEANELL